MEQIIKQNYNDVQEYIDDTEKSINNEVFYISSPYQIETPHETIDNDIPKLIFIVPYRDREQQLIFFKRHIQYILEDYSNLDYKLMIIHQKDKRSFNCGAIKNIGFLIVKDLYPNDYQDITLVFNDVDTMPFSKNFINFQTNKGIIKHFYGFKHALGGILSIKCADFEKINGFPNFWAWGYEDNMLHERVIQNRISIDRTQFFPFADKNILHFYDGYLKQVNKTEFERYVNHTHEGINSITNLEYSYNEESKLYDITHFDTGNEENKNTTRIHDLHNGTVPFNHIRSSRRNGMSMVL